MNVSFTKSGKGTGGYLAWLIDWSPARQKDPAEWRGLTTTENATVIPGDIAQGYRIKVGKSQWLIYRSMIPPEDARAVLSLHTSHETSINTVTPKGEIVPILMVDH